MLAEIGSKLWLSGLALPATILHLLNSTCIMRQKRKDSYLLQKMTNLSKRVPALLIYITSILTNNEVHFKHV